MKMKALSMFALGVSLLSAALPAFAHHSFQAEYDRSKPLTLTGKLTKVAMENPHGWLYIDAQTSEGKVINWALELPGPAVLRRNGFDQNIFETLRNSGEVVTVTAYPAKDGSKHAFGSTLTRADGQTVITLARLRPGRGFDRGQDSPSQPQ